MRAVVRRLYGLALPATMLLAAASGAGATVIPQYVTGIIAGPFTVDTYGVFGPAGTNLAGEPVTVFTQYNPSKAQFPNVYYCGFGCLEYETAKRRLDTPGAVLIVIDLAGRHLVSVPRRAALLTFPVDCPGLGVGTDPMLPGSTSVWLPFPSVIGFGDMLSPRINPVNPVACSLAQLGLGTSSGVEALTFTIDKTAR